MTDANTDIIRERFERVGIHPRAADIAVIQMLGGDLETQADYVWDHYLGEPDSPTLEEVEKAMGGTE